MTENFQIIVILCVLIVLNGCASNKNCPCDMQQSQILANDSLIDWSFDWNWERIGYQHLSEIDGDVFRLQIRPAHHSQEASVTTLSKTDTAIVLSIDYYNSTKNGTGIDTLNRIEMYYLDDSDWNRYEELVDKSCFWSMSCGDTTGKTILDGVAYILEGKRREMHPCTNRDFHFVGYKRGYGPEEFFDLCHAISELSATRKTSYNNR